MGISASFHKKLIENNHESELNSLTVHYMSESNLWMGYKDISWHMYKSKGNYQVQIFGKI